MEVENTCPFSFGIFFPLPAAYKIGFNQFLNLHWACHSVRKIVGVLLDFPFNPVLVLCMGWGHPTHANIGRILSLLPPTLRINSLLPTPTLLPPFC